MSLAGGLGARWAFTENRIRSVYVYRTDILIWLIAPAMQLVLMAALWRAIYNGRSTLDGVSLSVMTTYVSLAAIQNLINWDDTIDWLTARVRDGKIGADMARPVGIVTQQVCGQVAQLIVKTPMIVLMLPVIFLFSDLSAPAEGALGWYLLSTLVGWLLNCCIGLLVASVVFWTLEMGGMEFLYSVLSGFLSGVLVPLWVMPDWLRTILEWLPWQAVVYTPLAIYVGRFEGTRVWQAIGVQFLWLAVIGGLTWLVWRRAVNRVVVQGG
ncbi:ABC-2 family transporter protein [Phytomonospora sp. NPDC050363]|uniref:ABC transporter permease n=1 Tax=Phytomonospora sp. NPDC050363 TaxID=3155642 RepID=UPI0033E080D5